ncbi:hypothetical protein [Erythrobacter tepidarius]|uniref:hypothetical protein n=1 Tax=Erythrobacter tepidarius TaxID=60454 RepID=UPI000A3B6187|nr:hypothetical protein [Erythrobacter tepidarius]
MSIVWLLAAGLVAGVEEGLSLDVQSLVMVPLVIFAVLMMMAIGTLVSAVLVAAIGVPVAWALGSRRDTPAGLAPAGGRRCRREDSAELLFRGAPLFRDDGPFLALTILAYAPPASLLPSRGAVRVQSQPLCRSC